ncbi:Phosphoribosyl-ATP pyrophosphatase [Moraxella caprae]|uniref:Phosphoribosyl-ATP pyrophosphatase n=1 Tax=Moraxella caprae TaxID=90240 RepID=A0A378R1K4_9GAMM|nr:bifunctional phosphoribosyl-AMP cyclohydrolase/phosphoribosyl-ATP diphosphatase HisIE [Moraxella caprae]STZ07730.1 Phosphoribosyl-ATP pyrophosphatase [Moraxella caprae]
MLFSRTKNRLWVKGETSGNFLKVVEMGLDCDNDSLLILVNPVGVTCHTGVVSCFDKSDMPDLVFLANLEKLINERKTTDSNSSHTTQLFATDTKRIAQKVGEEGVETALAATVQDKDETVSEASDLVYHLTVLLQASDLAWADVLDKLKERHGK